MNKLNLILANIKKNLLEYYTLVLLSVGLPLVAFLYFDIRAAFAALVVVQSIIMLFALKGAKS